MQIRITKKKKKFVNLVEHNGNLLMHMLLRVDSTTRQCGVKRYPSF